MATHSSTLAWKIPWTEEPGRLQSMASLRVGHDWTTSLSLFIFIHWRRKWNPLQCSCLVNLGDGGAWWAAVYGVAQSRTRLKRLSSSSSSKTNQVFWTQIHACSTCCMWGTCLGLGSCLGIISWCEGPSGSISCFQMKNQDQESRRGLAKVAVDQGNWVTSRGLELRQVGVGVSVPQELCDLCVRLPSCGMNPCGPPSLSWVVEAFWTPAALGAALALLPGGEAVCSIWPLAGPRAWGASFDLLESYSSSCQGQRGWKCEGLQCYTKGNPNLSWSLAWEV